MPGIPSSTQIHFVILMRSKRFIAPTIDGIHVSDVLSHVLIDGDLCGLVNDEYCTGIVLNCLASVKLTDLQPADCA
jgi:hypothetical protein